ncbi:MAG: peptidyl-alpha-hydroxyglycine alpha-amidating lyase family protein [Fuerstiella sp.]|nr:peptidyl-alpha-hydroxyglycine alpha-amidating lyase family protein [Fuerstiella sp.]
MRKVGSGEFVYEEVKSWAGFPKDWKTEDAPAVAVDSLDRVFVLIRNEKDKDGLLIFDREGNFLNSWGENLFVRPHGLFIGPDDSVYVVDDWGHRVSRFTPDGDVTMMIDTRDQPADTGYVRGRHEVARAGPPFNEPTGCALAPGGGLYVSDGYGNARMHKFTSDGRLLLTWGEPGDGPGQFRTPHGVFVDGNGLVHVSDRMNRRVQVFSPQGEYLNEWNANYPNNVCIDARGYIYVAEMGGFLLYGRQPRLDKLPARVTVRDSAGAILSEWSEVDPIGTGQYFCPHSTAVDSRGDLYVSEVATSYNFGTAPADWGVLRKYVKV